MKNIFFSIVIPSFQRPDLLLRAVSSVLNHKVKNQDSTANTNDNDSEKNNHNNNESGINFDFEILVINDSPLFDYSNFENFLNQLDQNEKEKIKYFKNPKNFGKNYSLNLALKNISPFSDYIIFLDDDDWLNTNTLADLAKELRDKNIKWLITNRVTENQKSLTKINKTRKSYNYFWDYLIFKNISGDATHIIQTSLAQKYNFSQKIQNGEEWLYFIQINSPIIYKNIHTTISGGYLQDGVTDEIKNKYKEQTKILWQEILNNKKLFFNSKILFYMILRSLKNLLH